MLLVTDDVKTDLISSLNRTQLGQYHNPGVVKLLNLLSGIIIFDYVRTSPVILLLSRCVLEEKFNFQIIYFGRFATRDIDLGHVGGQYRPLDDNIKFEGTIQLFERNSCFPRVVSKDQAVVQQVRAQAEALVNILLNCSNPNETYGFWARPVNALAACLATIRSL